MTPWLVLAGAMLIAAVVTEWTRRLAIDHGLLDVPNARSSHVSATPRGGGIAIVLAVAVAGVFVVVVSPTDRVVLVWPALAGLAVAMVGLLDDRQGLSAGIRFAVHSIAALVVLIGTARSGPLEVAGLDLDPFVAGALSWLGLVWLTNLFNFMDGIDGLAGMEGAFVSSGLALCLYLSSGTVDRIALISMATAGACLGFLAWNWPPAKIFMGDVGSGFLGFLLGTLGLWAVRETPLNLWVPLILLALFVTDATVTLLRRVARGERWYQAHRSHAYQRLSRRWGSHQSVTLTALSINVAWLLPLAILAALRGDLGGVAAIVAYFPLVLGAIIAGAGMPDGARASDSARSIG